MQPPQIKTYEWRHEDKMGNYLISTLPNLLDLDFINRSLATSDMYWAEPLTTQQLTLMLSQSRTFGLYKALPSLKPAESVDEPSSPRTPSPTLEAESDEHLQQIGLARFITDHVTFVYISDVYIEPTYRGRGLGKWLMSCFQDVLQGMPMIRRAFLLTSSDKTRSFYAEELGFWDVKEKEPELIVMSTQSYPPSA